MRLRILQANIYRANRRLDAAAAVLLMLLADLVTINEGINFVRYFRWSKTLQKQYDILVSKVRSRGAWDAPILVRRRHEVLGVRNRWETRPALPAKWAPARMTRSARYEHESGLRGRHFALHLNAVIQSKRTWGPILQAARTIWAGRQMASLERQIKRAIRHGLLVTVAGDLNWHDRAPSGEPWKWAPQEVFARCGFDWIEHGVDWIAFPDTWRAVDTGVVDQDETGSDHPWLWADIEPRPTNPKEHR